MQVRKQEEGDQFVYQLEGKFTFTDNMLIRDLLADIPNRKEHRILFDMSRLEFIDSAALGMLMLSQEKASDCQKSVSIRGAGGQVSKMLSMARFENFFTII